MSLSPLRLWMSAEGSAQVGPGCVIDSASLFVGATMTVRLNRDAFYRFTTWGAIAPTIYPAPIDRRAIRAGEYEFFCRASSGGGGSAQFEIYFAENPCLADFNDDGFVDFFDFDDFVSCFGESSCPPNRTADFNNDGFIDFFDFDDFVYVFSTGC